MENRKFKRAASITKTKAFLFTFLFHLAALGAILNHDSYEKIGQLLPDTVKEWLGITDTAVEQDHEADQTIRP